MEHPGDDERLVGLAVKALEMLANTGLGPLEEGEPELGRPLCKGEVPHAQACVLYILRVGIIERLGEAGQVFSCGGRAAALKPEAHTVIIVQPDRDHLFIKLSC